MNDRSAYNDAKTHLLAVFATVHLTTEERNAIDGFIIAADGYQRSQRKEIEELFAALTLTPEQLDPNNQDNIELSRNAIKKALSLRTKRAVTGAGRAD